MWAKGAWGYQLSQHSFIDTGLILQLKHILAICQSYPNCITLFHFSLDNYFLLCLNGLENWNVILHFLPTRKKKKKNSLKWGTQQHINFVNHYWHNSQFYMYANINLFLEMYFSNISQPRAWSITMIPMNKYE